MIRVLVADDHKVVRAGLAAIIGLEPDMCVLGEAADGARAVALCRELRPDVVVMDLKMPGMTGWQATAAIRREAPECRVLVFSTCIGDEQVYRAIQAGALGYVMKEAEESELTGAIRDTHAGRRTLPAAVAAALERRLAFDPLTAREIDILKRVASGMGNREAGESLGLSEQTVKGYLKSIVSKLGAGDRTAAVVIAVQRGLIEVEKIEMQLDAG